MIILDALAFNADTNIILGSAIVPETPPVETSKAPNTLLALLRNNTLNCSTKSILFSSQVCFKSSAASLDVLSVAFEKIYFDV